METPQLSEPAHSPNARVTGIGDLAYVVHHLMSVVGPKRYKVIDLLSGLEHGFHRGVNIDVAIKVV